MTMLVRSNASPDHRCTLCHGSHGTLVGGQHLLCGALAAAGRPTPNLGERCTRCEGRGWWRADGGPRGPLPVYFNPFDCARGTRAIFPECPDCGGRGHTPPAEKEASHG